jgi:hypothetical protein
MRNRLVIFLPILLAMSFCAPPLFAQRRLAQNPSSKFDSKDFTGFWIRLGTRPNDHPQFTDRAENMMRGRRPDYLQLSPLDSNDPMYSCNPQGFPRLTWEENEPFEIVHTRGRILHLYEQQRTLREIWMDGRPLPSGESLDNLGPNWYGHSVGVWEGDTLVVTTTGFDERMWLDEWGHPISFDAKVEERYRLIDSNTIEGQLTINDPKVFEKPWVQPKQMFRRMSDESVTHFGWRGLFSGISDGVCAPMNDIEDFDRRLKIPAARGLSNSATPAP